MHEALQEAHSNISKIPIEVKRKDKVDWSSFQTEINQDHIGAEAWYAKALLCRFV